MYSQGVANETYFMPGEPHPLPHSPTGADIALLGPAFDLSIRASLIENHSPPEILVHGLVTPDDVDHLRS